jgi:ribosomal protein L19E
MIQVDGIKRQVLIKLVNSDNVQKIIKETNGEAKYKHHSGEVSTVGIDAAGLGTKRVRVANLPPIVPDTALRTLLAPFGKVQKIQQEMWTKMYRYPVSNGIRQVTIILTKHIPSHLNVAKNRVLLSYEGQPSTCYVCGETGHMLQTCPKRRHKGNATETLQRESYAEIAAQNEPSPERPATIETTVIQMNATEDNTEQVPLTKTHNETEQ